MLSDDTIPGNIPILILGNKIDRPNAVSEDDIKDAFHLHDKTTGKVHHVPCGVINMLSCNVIF